MKKRDRKYNYMLIRTNLEYSLSFEELQKINVSVGEKMTCEVTMSARLEDNTIVDLLN